MKVCLRCGKEYVRLELHLARKKVCTVKYLDICGKEILNNYEELYKEYKKMIEDKFECENCGKLFNKCSSLSRHRNNYCKILKQQKDKQESEESQSTQLTQNTINNGMIVNGTQNNNVNVDNSINIILNNFGEEKDLPIDQIKQILNECVKGRIDELLPKYIKKMWIDTAENNNINVLDLSRGIAEIYKDNEWQKALLDEVTDTVRVKSSNKIEGYVKDKKLEIQTELGGEYTQKPIYNKMNKIWNHLDDISDNNNIKKKIDKKIKFELENGRVKVRGTKKKIVDDYVDF